MVAIFMKESLKIQTFFWFTLKDRFKKKKKDRLNIFVLTLDSLNATCIFFSHNKSNKIEKGKQIIILSN